MLLLHISYSLYFITEQKSLNVDAILRDALHTALFPTSHLHICFSHCPMTMPFLLWLD